MARKWAARLLVTLGCLLILAGIAYFGAIKYFSWRESVSPSTSRVLVLKDGTRVPLRQPTIAPRPAPTTIVSTSAFQPADGRAQGLQAPAVAASAVSTSTSTSMSTSTSTSTSAPISTSLPANQIMPPVRLTIPGIKVDWPVVLNNGHDLPKFKGIGWMFGSAFPGAAGNLVLFGHLDGKYATLGRLHELKSGDTFSVLTDDGEYHYQIRSLFETTPDDVGDGPNRYIHCYHHHLQRPLGRPQANLRPPPDSHRRLHSLIDATNKRAYRSGR